MEKKGCFEKHPQKYMRHRIAKILLITKFLVIFGVVFYFASYYTMTRYSMLICTSSGHNYAGDFYILPGSSDLFVSESMVYLEEKLRYVYFPLIIVDKCMFGYYLNSIPQR